jgi:hypothetical protein
MLDRLYTYLGTRDLPGEPEALKRLAVRLEELAALNGQEWVRANRDMLLMQWRIALGHCPAGAAAAKGEGGSDG